MPYFRNVANELHTEQLELLELLGRVYHSDMVDFEGDMWHSVVEVILAIDGELTDDLGARR